MKLQYSLLAISMSACSMTVSAAPTPNSGQLLQQQQQGQLNAPQTAVEVESNPMIPQSQDSQLQVTVNQIKIEGNSRFSTAQLHALTADAEGQNLT